MGSIDDGALVTTVCSTAIVTCDPVPVLLPPALEDVVPDFLSVEAPTMSSDKRQVIGARMVPYLNQEVGGVHEDDSAAVLDEMFVARILLRGNIFCEAEDNNVELVRAFVVEQLPLCDADVRQYC
jgi:hypothetical protein